MAGEYTNTEVLRAVRNDKLKPGWDAALDKLAAVGTRQTTIAIANTWYDLKCSLNDIHIQDFTNGTDAVYEYNGTGDKFQLLAVIRFTHTAPNASVEIVWAINGTPCACGPMGTLAKTAGEGYHVMVFGVPDLTDGDVARVQVRSSATGTIELLDMQSLGGIK